jgi:hypothetical protein
MCVGGPVVDNTTGNLFQKGFCLLRLGGGFAKLLCTGDEFFELAKVLEVVDSITRSFVVQRWPDSRSLGSDY